MAKSKNYKTRPAKVILVDGISLTPMEFSFCNHYLQHFNATRAVVDAGYSLEGKEPRVKAYDLMKKERIKKYITMQLKAHILKEKTAAIMDQMMTSDLGEIYHQAGNSFEIDKMREAGVSHLVKKHKKRIITRTDKDGNTTVTEEMEIEREDKIRAAEVLAKIEGWVKPEISLNINEVPLAQKVRERCAQLKDNGILKNKKRK